MYFCSALFPGFLRIVTIQSVKAEELGQLTMAKDVILSLKTLAQLSFNAGIFTNTKSRHFHSPIPLSWGWYYTRVFCFGL